MPIEATCRECGHHFEAPMAAAGLHYLCPRCGAPVPVPSPPGGTPPAGPWRCPGCGVEYRAGVRACPLCGF